MSYGYKRQRNDGLRGLRARSKAGWGMNLYRNSREGKIAGVSAGLADHWEVAHWVVRLMWVAAFLFLNMFAVYAYIGAWILLSPRPRPEGFAEEYAPDGRAGAEMEYDEYAHEYRPRKVFRYSEDSAARLKIARERLDNALRRVESMESYVTSRQYQLNKEFSKL